MSYLILLKRITDALILKEHIRILGGDYTDERAFVFHEPTCMPGRDQGRRLASIFEGS